MRITFIFKIMTEKELLVNSVDIQEKWSNKSFIAYKWDAASVFL